MARSGEATISSNVTRALLLASCLAGLATPPSRADHADLDGDRGVYALSDGLLLLRHQAGFHDDALVAGSMTPADRALTAEGIGALIELSGAGFDLDGNASTDLLTDGLLFTRYLSGFRGDALVQRALGAGASRPDPAQVAAFAQEQLAAIHATACAPAEGDSEYWPDAPPEYSLETLWTPSHAAVETERYGLLTTRHKADGSEVTMDYMVHEPPVGEPRALLVLIAGGALTANIESTGGPGDQVTRSGGNFLVRSAHRFAARGFRVVTVDRPSDWPDYFTTSSASNNYDPYRNSMLHAVDLARVAALENAVDRLPLVLVGTSRGSISAFANNSLAVGMALSGPLTAGNRNPGTPIGPVLPLSLAVRPAHVLFHELDTCVVTPASGAVELHDALQAGGHEVDGDRVGGGFIDTRDNNDCGAFHYHGFLGVETCAVARHADWIERLLVRVGDGGNRQPEAQGRQFQLAAGGQESFQAEASDADGDELVFAVPYGSSVLGGLVQVTPGGEISYFAPAGLHSTTDSFVYTADDGRGGVAFGIVSIELLP